MAGSLNVAILIGCGPRMLAVAGDAGVMVRKDSPMKAAWSYLLGFTAIVLVTSPADAQLMGNAPYQPRAGNIGGRSNPPGSRLEPPPPPTNPHAHPRAPPT